MDINSWAGRLKGWIMRFRYPILVILAGILLLTLPGKKKENSTATDPVALTGPSEDLTLELTEILQQIKGVGRVQVLLTISKGEQTHYQEDSDQSTDETGTDIRTETVIIRDADDRESALIIQVIPPEYLGAIVVCDGADDASVKLAVLEAVAKATGLRSDRISVLKMK
ncbi:MAG: hypothetical protein E7438_00995 [Ruminococcaceae bacterium]|nr:hypothetical protein [Oscillospiraceae bacterium]